MLWKREKKRSTDSEKHWCNGAKKMFKHRPFVNFVKYFLPLRRRRPRRNAVYFSKQHFYFSSTRKRRLWRTKKRGGREGERSLHSSCRCVLACCWHKEKRGEWKEKRKYILSCLCVCAHFMCVYIYAHVFSLRLFRDACSVWLFSS